MTAPRARRAALALAAAVFALAAPVAYVAQRIYEVARSGPVDPLLILRDSHTGFYWRAATATWWAGLFAIMAYGAARNDGPRARLARALAWSGLPLVIVVVLLAWWLP
jgi:hypothetical protein